MQDRISQRRPKPLAPHGRTIHWVRSAALVPCPITSGLPRQTDILAVDMSQTCHERISWPNPSSVDATVRKTILADENALSGKGDDTSRRMDQVSASLTCPAKKGSRRFRFQRGNAWPTTRNPSILRDARSRFEIDPEQPHDQNANRSCCCGRGGTFLCATGVGTI